MAAKPKGKKVTGIIKLQIPAGQANPSPPVGPALGQAGVPIMDFCKQFNAKTSKMEPGLTTPVVISVYRDKTFTFEIKTPPASVLIKKAAGLAKGSAEANKDKVGSITKEQLKEIAQTKLPDLNTNKIEPAMNIIEGTARNMGVLIK